MHVTFGEGEIGGGGGEGSAIVTWPHILVIGKHREHGSGHDYDQLGIAIKTDHAGDQSKNVAWEIVHLLTLPISATWCYLVLPGATWCVPGATGGEGLRRR